jgi:hypothetical protein
VIVALSARLHPRHWDGQRFLQFLTGLALLALAFAAPLAPSSVAPAPAAVLAAPATETVAVEEPAGPAAVEVPAPPAAETCRLGASGYRPVVPPADTSTALTGVEQRAHGSRGPPRA